MMVRFLEQQMEDNDGLTQGPEWLSSTGSAMTGAG
jgi:hypothetical protein